MHNPVVPSIQTLEESGVYREVTEDATNASRLAQHIESQRMVEASQYFESEPEVIESDGVRTKVTKRVVVRRQCVPSDTISPEKAVQYFESEPEIKEVNGKRVRITKRVVVRRKRVGKASSTTSSQSSHDELMSQSDSESVDLASSTSSFSVYGHAAGESTASSSHISHLDASWASRSSMVGSATMTDSIMHKSLMSETESSSSEPETEFYASSDYDTTPERMSITTRVKGEKKRLSLAQRRQFAAAAGKPEATQDGYLQIGRAFVSGNSSPSRDSSIHDMQRSSLSEMEYGGRESLSMSSSNISISVEKPRPSGQLERESERPTTLVMDEMNAMDEVDNTSQHHYIQVETPRAGGGNLFSNTEKFTLEWRNISLRKHVRNEHTKILEEQAIFQDISGIAKAGELLMITGAQRETNQAILDCLAGKMWKTMDGNLIVNGMPWTQHMHRYCAYVERNDLFHETITVREHLIFQAQLRLSKTYSEDQYMQQVDNVIDELDLVGCQDLLIGGSGKKIDGISRGERKRLSLATELLSNPSILFVEEPTFGMDDGHMAEDVIQKLQHIARSGRTVIVTMHETSSQLFALFDTLHLVSDGSVIYHGRISEAVEYFASIGFQCPTYVNPADYFMREFVVLNQSDKESIGILQLETLKEAWAKRASAIQSVENETDEEDGDESSSNKMSHIESAFKDTRLGCCGQFTLLFRRHVLRLTRYGFEFWWYMLIIFVIGILFGLVYRDLDLDQRGIQNFAGAYFYLIVIQMCIFAYRTFIYFPTEMTVALREQKSGIFRLSCWYFINILCELPALIVLSIVLLVPAYLLIGIGHSFKMYLYMQVILVLTGGSAIALGYLVLCMFRRLKVSLIVYIVFMSLVAVFSGLLMNASDIPDYMIWLHYISPITYGYEALMKIFWGHVFDITCDPANENCVALTGAEVLAHYSMEDRSGLGDGLLLFLIVSICLAVGFHCLRFRARK